MWHKIMYRVVSYKTGIMITNSFRDLLKKTLRILK